MEIFRQAPDRVTHICLMDTRHHPLPAGEAGEKERDGRMHLVGVAREHGTRVMGEEWIKGMIHPDRLQHDPVLVNTILDMFARKSADVFAAQQNALLTRPEAADVMGRIKCPALILCGRQDSWSTPLWHEAMAREIGHASLKIVENCGHMSTMERPEEVTRAMRDWIGIEPG